jgi:hypothetical protein
MVARSLSQQWERNIEQWHEYCCLDLDVKQYFPTPQTQVALLHWLDFFSNWPMDTPVGFTRVLRWVWNLMCTSMECNRNSSASTREFIREWFSEGVFFENLGAEGTKKVLCCWMKSTRQLATPTTILVFKCSRWTSHWENSGGLLRWSPKFSGEHEIYFESE